jgi:hypothetical protein
MVVDTPVQVPVTQPEPEVENRTNGNGNDDGGSSGGEEIENVHRYSICNFFHLKLKLTYLASSRKRLSLLTKNGVMSFRQLGIENTEFTGTKLKGHLTCIPVH